MKILAIYSNKGGVGKTAAAVNLSYLASQAGFKTLLCDLDPQGSATYYFRSSSPPRYPRYIMKRLAIYSNKGGVGKTAAAVNLSYLASQAGFILI